MRWLSIFIVFFSASAIAEPNVSGSISAQLRYFDQEPQWSGQFYDTQASIALEPEFRTEIGQGKFTAVPFYRHDEHDDERSHFDIRELHWQTQLDDWDLLIGINRVFLGVTESRHLVDIINQTDYVENIDNEDKLGQPMVQARWLQDWGTLDLFVLPGFRERTFPGIEGRLRTALPVDVNNTQYESGAEEQHIDLAVRYSHVIDDWDIGVSFFYGTSREPRLLPNGSNTLLIPYYDLINQLGLDAQYTHDAWLWKIEVIGREGHGKTFGAMVAGFEYTFYQLATTSADLGVLFEYLYDDRDMNAPFTFTDDDLFVGLRLALNDVDDTSMIAGVIVDRHTDEKLVSIEAKTRLSEHWTLDAEARWFTDIDIDSSLNNFSQDDYIQLELAYHF